MNALLNSLQQQVPIVLLELIALDLSRIQKMALCQFKRISRSSVEPKYYITFYKKYHLQYRMLLHTYVFTNQFYVIRVENIFLYLYQIQWPFSLYAFVNDQTNCVTLVTCLETISCHIFLVKFTLVLVLVLQLDCVYIQREK